MPVRKVLVTGAGGYVGRHVVTALLDRGVEVIATVRPGSRSEVDPRATIVTCDVLSPDLELGSLHETPPHTVIHLAWQDGFAHNSSSHILRLSDHFRFLERMVDWGVSRLSVLGTMHEVGYWEGAIDASTPTNPLSLYGIAKDALRAAASTSFASRVELQWLRCYYILGDDRNNQSIFTRLLETADRGEKTFPFTSGRNRYDFISVQELALQIAVVSGTNEAGIINCSSGEPVSLADRVEQFIADNRLDIRLEYGAYPDRPYDSPGVWGDATRIKAIMAAHAQESPAAS